MLEGVSWHIPQKVLYSQFSGTLNLQEMQEMMQLGYDMIEAEGSDTGVHGIVDVTRCEAYAKDLMNLQAMRSLLRLHRRAGWIVIIDPTPHPVLRFVSLSVITVMKLNYAVVTSEAEAMEILYRVDPTLAQV